ncbi:unnamed protein product [Linum trigynum]|uniref:Uncharacterized protein n=1 Tax=Linum trigynum TaxID=586398 RepID=A0AAV2FD26_9ROSI
MQQSFFLQPSSRRLCLIVISRPEKRRRCCGEIDGDARDRSSLFQSPSPVFPPGTTLCPATEPEARRTDCGGDFVSPTCPATELCFQNNDDDFSY